VVITDKKIPYDDGTRWKYYTADVVSTQDYYAFGQGIEERGFSRGSSKYRYSYNCKETDDETGIQDYGFRMYDSRLCRFLSVDPLAEEYPWYTPYQFAGNKPIVSIDIDGLESDGKASPEIEKPQKGSVEVSFEGFDGREPKMLNSSNETTPQNYTLPSYTASMLPIPIFDNISNNLNPFSGGALFNVWNWQVREDYIASVKELKPYYLATGLNQEHVWAVDRRVEFKNIARERLIGTGKLLNLIDPNEPKYVSTDGIKANPRTYITNSGVNVMSRVSGVLGLYSLYQTGNNLYNANQQGRLPQQLGIEVSKMAGARLGMSIGAQFVLFSPWPVFKHPIVALVTVGVTTAIGSFGGEKGAKFLQSFF
jgi:RHS repeat-associated protein